MRAHEANGERDFSSMRIIWNYSFREAMFGGLFVISESNWLEFNTGIGDALTLPTRSVSIATDPVALVGKWICGQGYSLGISRKQRFKIQRVSLDIEVGDCC